MIICTPSEVSMNENDDSKFSKPSLSSPEAPRREKNPAIMPRCIAVIARDSLKETPDRFSRRKQGFWPFFPRIAYEASKHGANVLMFSSWSHNENRLGRLSKKDLFPAVRGIQPWFWASNGVMTQRSTLKFGTDLAAHHFDCSSTLQRFPAPNKGKSY
jgi:hypothetical protein